ncbi:hypothetical protein [Aurantiacibacter aquimixticola]|uniref:Thiamine biosynthesis protein ThiC n=1 Tax=Aurantiacibacter aquimixticola TaxID=1958945 RepID=A0A419RVY1_9SPHN|nr:hypothetical protein [Aurantiacibacter aquimixticola]RJY09931.1 hypothetical protein D6201_11765 [Aurantiacibacter aquimixticola]
MTQTSSRIAPITIAFIAIALFTVVVTQVLYISLGVSGTPAATMLWQVEAVAFLAIALFGFAWLRWPLVAAGLVIGGTLNVLQIGIGLTMFGPLGGAGETLGPVMGAVLAFAFFLYHTGKIAFGVAGAALGARALAGATGWPKIAGVLAGLTGLAAVLTNLWAIFAGREAMFIAGAAGTTATVFLALAMGALRPTDAGSHA